MKRTIIYVFGPKRLVSKYYTNEEMRLEEGGWVKIGQKEEDDDSINKWDSTVCRVNQEPRTGIPEISQIYDVFEYPYMKGNMDDEIRKILTNDIYQLESSKVHNKNVEKYEIKAGREFVYGVTRSQLLNAIAKFERNLILDKYGSEEFDDVMKLIRQNNSVDEVALEPKIEDDKTDIIDTKYDWCNNLWSRVTDKCKESIKENINDPKGRPYIWFKSSTSSISYSAGYSVRYGIISVGIEIFTGEEGKNDIERFIEDHNVTEIIPNIVQKQGTKNKEKWSWSVSESLDKTDDELINWFVDNILLFYRTFENNTIKNIFKHYYDNKYS